MPNDKTYDEGVADVLRVLYRMHYEKLTGSYQHPDSINLKNNEILREDARALYGVIERVVREIYSNERE